MQRATNCNFFQWVVEDEAHADGDALREVKSANLVLSEALEKSKRNCLKLQKKLSFEENKGLVLSVLLVGSWMLLVAVVCIGILRPCKC